MAERSKAAVLKTARRVSASRVRIPPSPRLRSASPRCAGRDCEARAEREPLAPPPPGHCRGGLQRVFSRPSQAADGASRRGGRVAEGTGLLNLHTGNRIEGSNPSLSASPHAIRRRRAKPMQGPRSPTWRIRPVPRSEPKASEVDERRGGRVAEGTRLESACTGNGTVGSNPTLSAIRWQAGSLGSPLLRCARSSVG